MIHRILSVVLVASLAIVTSDAARADVEVTISKMHLCCGACVEAVEGAIEKVESAAVKVDKDAGSAVVTAPDLKTARKALGAIGHAGFHGETNQDKLKMPDNSGVKEGMTQRIELVGLHNCCGGCNKAIKAAIATVEGVQADTAKPKSKSVVIEGDFDALAVVTALNKAGFHVRSKVAAQEAAEARKKKAEEK